MTVSNDKLIKSDIWPNHRNSHQFVVISDLRFIQYGTVVIEVHNETIKIHRFLPVHIIRNVHWTHFLCVVLFLPLIFSSLFLSLPLIFSSFSFPPPDLVRFAYAKAAHIQSLHQFSVELTSFRFFMHYHSFRGRIGYFNGHPSTEEPKRRLFFSLSLSNVIKLSLAHGFNWNEWTYPKVEQQHNNLFAVIQLI